ncbi:MAG TPA: VCBS repeat-containing protein [bacterium]|nr:VCBS repeat-containing protein [bacterium]
MRSFTKASFALFTTLTLGLAACGSGRGPSPSPTPTPTPLPTPLVLDFGTPTTLEAGTVPSKAQALFVADLAGDDNLDFAILNSTIGVFVGNGDGTFDPRQDATSLVNGPSALTGGATFVDPNDLVAAFPSTNQFDIYFDPNRDGAYADNAPFNGGVAPEGIALGDFDGDGDDDVVLPGSDGDLYLRLNQGSVTFNPFSFPSAGALTNPRNIVAADFDGDDRDDVAIADFGGDRITVWLNSADANPAFLFPGSNASSLALPAGSGVQGVTAADLNDDGFPEVIAANPTPDNISVFVNNGDGTFAAKVDYPAGQDAFATAVADFNLDGVVDIVVANAFGVDGVNGDFCVYLGNGDATFEAPQTFTAGVDGLAQPNHPRSVAVGDFNDDGKPDLVFASNPGDSAVVVLNTSAQP